MLTGRVPVPWESWSVVCAHNPEIYSHLLIQSKLVDSMKIDMSKECHQSVQQIGVRQKVRKGGSSLSYSHFGREGRHE